MDVTGLIKVTVKASRDFTADLTSASASIAQILSTELANGTEAEQMDLVFADTVTDLAAEGVQSYNLDALTDPVTGGAVAFVRIRAIVIYSKAAGNKALTIGGVANAFKGWFGDAADTEILQPLGLCCHVAPGAGWTVTPATGDILAITNAAGGASSFDVYILGASAAPA